MPLPLLKQTVAAAVLIHRVAYNYAPAVIHDGALYHLYWCAGADGDTILHLQAPALAGPWRPASFWSRFDVALRPTRSPLDFDGRHTCDPNVIKLGGTFYLYYTGEAKDGALGAIGVAASRDAIHFERLNGGKPIVLPAKSNATYAADGLTYGAGQPAAAFVTPYVYLSFTDSTGAGGDGQYVLRSPDPVFGKDVEELTGAGWQPRAPGQRSGALSWLESYGLDLMFDPPSGTLLAATDRVAGETTVIAIDPKTMQPLAEGDLPLAWREGPSLVAEADKTSAPRPRCDDLQLAVAAAAGASESPLTWDALGYSVGEFSLASVCGRHR